MLLSLLVVLGCATSSVDAAPPAPVAQNATVELAYGTQCDGVEPKIGGLEALLTGAGVTVISLEAMAVCEACSCPDAALQLVVPADQETLARTTAASLPTGSTTVQISVGKACEPRPEGAPENPTALLAAIEAAGVKVLRHEGMMSCAACGCPSMPMAIEVADEQVEALNALVGPWNAP